MVPPDRRTSDWHELRELLSNALLFSTDESPIQTRSGARMPWQFDPWPVALTEHGSRLIGRCLAAELSASFSSVQVAARGLRALPMLTACIREGDGRYRGLAIRDARKSYGSGRLIEGGDPSQSVVIIDDALATGTSLREAVKALEEAGYRVEGCLSLVIFPARGGDRWARSLGYRVASIFESWADLDFPRSSPRWTGRPPEVTWSGRSNASDLASYAHEVVASYAAGGAAPRPSPALECLDQLVSGIFVSLRDPVSGRRLARQGFVMVPGYDRGDGVVRQIAADTARVTAEAVDAAGRTNPQSRLEDSAVAVTVFGELEPIKPSKIDSARFGLVVINEMEPWHVGAVLPNLDDVRSDFRQYRRARTRANAVGPVPHKLYRHTVVKHISPGARWHKSGVPSPVPRHEWVEFVDALAADVALCLSEPLPVESTRSPQPAYLDRAAANRTLDLVAGISLRLYVDGRECGETIEFGEFGRDPFVSALHRLITEAGLGSELAAAALHRTTAVLTVLHSPRTVKSGSVEDLGRRFRLGIDTVTVRSDVTVGTVPSYVAAQKEWSEIDVVRGALREAQSEDPAGSHWTAYQGDVRVCRADGAISVVSAALSRCGNVPGIDVNSKIERVAGHIAAHLGSDGQPNYAYDPLLDHIDRGGTIGRKALALKALGLAGGYLGRADFTAAALAGAAVLCTALDRGNPDRPLSVEGMLGGPPSDGLLLDALCELGLACTSSAGTAALIRRASQRFSPQGFVRTAAAGSFRVHDHGILAGIQLCAMARVVALAGPDEWGLEASLHRAFPWYARRFAERPAWDMVWWHAQAWSAMPSRSRTPEEAGFVLTLADWAVERQLDSDGSFLTDLRPEGPSFHTACVAEGIVEAAALARETDERTRWRRYALSWARAVGFMDCLTINSDDEFCVINPELALGGVRFSERSWSLRIDAAAHYLIALVKGASVFGVTDTVDLLRGGAIDG